VRRGAHPGIQLLINTPGIGPLFGHGSFSIENWAFTGNDPKHVTGVPANIVTVFNDNAGFYNPNDGNGHNFFWASDGFPVGHPKPPKYPGGSLQAQVATAIHEVAHGLPALNFQNDFMLTKPAQYNDWLVYQNCNNLIQGIQ